MKRQTVGIHELKQNPSEIIARAANGEQFEVLSSGKPVGVVIQRDAQVKTWWVSTENMRGLSLLGARDTTDWAEERRVDHEADSDPIVDPWDAVK